jgi:hypothetical protein
VPTGYDYQATQNIYIPGPGGSRVLAFATGDLVPDTTVTANGWVALGWVQAIGTPGPSITSVFAQSGVEYPPGSKTLAGTYMPIPVDHGAWVTATAYITGDVVTNGVLRYSCVLAHTSGTFATDLTAGKWVALTVDVSGTYAAKSANLSDLASASTARTNLGLAAVAASGSASDITTGTLAAARVGDLSATYALAAEPVGAAAQSSVNTAKANLKRNLKTDFGAVGDGTTDDTTAVQNWVNAIVNGGLAGYAPAGTYKITAAINFPYKPGWTIEGAGSLVTTFTQFTNNTPIFVLGGSAGTLTHRYRISDMSFDYNSSQSGNTSAVCLLFAQQCFEGTLRNLDFKAGYYGIGVTSGIGGPWGQSWDDLTFNGSLYGGAIDMSLATNAVPNNKFGRFFVDATNMAAPIFVLKGYNTHVGTIEIINAQQGPILLRLLAGAQFNIGAFKCENGTWTASTNLIDIQTNAGMRLQELFIGGTTSMTLNAPGGTVNAVRLASGCTADIRDAEAHFNTVTAGSAFLVQSPTDGRVKIGQWRTVSNTFALQSAASSVTSDGLTVENIANNHLSYDKGDADYTVTDGDPAIIVFNTALTAPRVVNLQNTLNNLFNGMRYRIMSLGAVNGSNTITVKQGSTTLGTISRDNQLIEFTSRRVPSGTSWFLTSLLDLSGAGGYTPTVNVFTSSGTYTKPAWATSIRVLAIGPGGSGGAGRRGAAASVRCGGGGGGGGAKCEAVFSAGDITSTVTVTIGTVATPGGAQTVDSTDGAAASGGTVTTFGTYLRAANGGNGSGGTATNGLAGGAVGGMFQSGAGGAASTTGLVGGTGAQSGTAGGGGGAGGGITSGDVAAAGGAAFEAADKPGSGTVAGGANTGGNGTAGINRTTNEPLGGCGGGGGGANLSGAGGTGGAGGNYGAGGGGGGASLNGNNSGAGGAGGPGIVVVITS